MAEHPNKNTTTFRNVSREQISLAQNRNAAATSGAENTHFIAELRHWNWQR
jgi:hypothetical protein